MQHERPNEPRERVVSVGFWIVLALMVAGFIAFVTFAVWFLGSGIVT